VPKKRRPGNKRSEKSPSQLAGENLRRRFTVRDITDAIAKGETSITALIPDPEDRKVLAPLFNWMRQEQITSSERQIFDIRVEATIDQLIEKVQPTPDEPVKMALLDALVERIRQFKDADAEISGSDLQALNDLAKWIVPSWRGGAGRPVTTAPRAVKALEMHEQGMSWSEVTKALCGCGKKSHRRKCLDNIRRQVLDLKKDLKKYKVLPESFLV